MYSMKTEEDWLEVYADQDKKIRADNPLWIPTLDIGRLPPKDVWVQLLDNDELNPQDKFWSEFYKKPTIRVIIGMLKCVNQWGEVEWQRIRTVSGHAKVWKNISHWQPLAKVPNISGFPYEE